MSSRIARVEGTITYEDGAVAPFAVVHTSRAGVFYRQEAVTDPEVNDRGGALLIGLCRAVRQQREEVDV